MVFNPLVNKQFDIPEQKHLISDYPWGGGGYSFVDYLADNGYTDLSAFASILLYRKAMPLFHAISMRAEAFAQIPIRLWDKQQKEFIDDHPVFDLLEKPNADMTRNELFEQIASYYDIAGDSFIYASGRIENPPLELATIGPQMVTFSTNSKFGVLNVPNKIYVTRVDGGSIVYTAEDLQDIGVRFVDDISTSELWHMRTFNPLRSGTRFRGMSRAQPIWIEIQQYVAGNVNNLSVLKRGTRLSMAWVNTTGKELTDTQWGRMQEEVQKYKGEYNADGTPLLDGFDVKPIQQTNRDMQFKDLQEATLARISTTYKVPLALLLPQTMTLNNLQTSMLQLYDNSVLPLTSRIYKELSNFLLPRYPDSENLEFRFNENDITALKVRILEQAEKLSRIKVNTLDEIRAVMGYEELDEGGNEVLRPANEIPVGSESIEIEDEEITEEEEKRLRKLLSEKYSEEEITTYLNNTRFIGNATQSDE